MTSYINDRIETINELESTLIAVRNGAKIESIFADFATDPAGKVLTEAEVVENLLGQYRLLAKAVCR